MEYFSQYVAKLSENFDNIPRFKQLADHFQVKTGHIALGLISFVFLFVVLGWGQVFLTNLLGIIYPAYMTFKAIETREVEDDKQWLTYWVVYGAFTVVDTLTESLLWWVPFYHPMKLLFLIYLAWPETRGAETVYNRFMRPFLLKHQDIIDENLSLAKKKLEEAKVEAAHHLIDSKSD